MLSRNVSRDVTIVVGKTGMGKTLWTRRYIIGRPRVIILDPVLEYEGLLFDDLTDMVHHVRDNRIYQVKGQFAADMPFLCDISMAVAGGESERHDVTLVIDEASRAVPSRLQLHPSFTNVVFRGRGRRLADGSWTEHVHLVVVSQRASSISIDARSQYTRLISFQQTEPNDVRAIENMTGGVMERLTTLQVGEYYESMAQGMVLKQLDLHDVTRRRDDASGGTDDALDRERGVRGMDGVRSLEEREALPVDAEDRAEHLDDGA
jgi:hypothetical protein